MPGFDNGVVFANNVDFTSGRVSQGDATMLTDGQLLIASTAVNAGNTHINVGVLTSPDSSLTVGYASPDITLVVNGATVGRTISGQSGGALNPTAGNWNISGGVASAGTSPIVTSGSGSTLTVRAQKSQAIAAADATKVGLSNFDSSAFAVDANGFVTFSGSSLVAGVTSSFFPSTLASFADNFTLTGTPQTYAEVINSQACTAATSPVFFERFVSGALGLTTIPAGPWTFNIYAAASSTVNNNIINFRVNKRVIQMGMTATFTGAGATRTFTVTGGAPFVAGDANVSRLLASLVETPTQTAWISAFTSSSQVTVTLTDPTFVNVAGVAFDAIYYFLFNDATPDMTATAVTLYTVVSVQPAFSVGVTDRLVLALFASTDGVASRTLDLYYGGTNHFTFFSTPLATSLTLTPDSGGALSPTINNFSILGLSGSKTSGSVSTLTIKSPPFSQIGTTATSSLNTGEFVTAAVTRTLPASVGLADGDLFIYVCTTALALVIQAVGAQQIRIGSALSTAAGTATSNVIGNSLSLRFNATDGFFYATSVVGTWITG